MFDNRTKVRKMNLNQDDQDQDILSTENDNNDPDIVLDIPNVKVGEVKLDVGSLEVKTSVNAQLSNLVNVEVGTTINLENVKLEVKDVDAEVHVRVRLNRIENILLSTLEKLDNNPELLKSLVDKVREGKEDGLKKEEPERQNNKAK